MSLIFYIIKMDVSQFSLNTKNETLLLKIVNFLLKVKQKPNANAQDILNCKITKPKQTYSFEKPSSTPQKWLIAIKDLQTCITFDDLTKVNNKVIHSERG